MNSLGSKSLSQRQPNNPSNISFTSDTSQPLKSSAYDRDFEQKCIDHNIQMPWEDTEPENWQTLQQRLAYPRPSLSSPQFSDGAFKRFRKAEAEARDEDDINREILPTILGEKQHDYPSAGNVVFRNIDDMAPDIFKKSKPDLYWEVRPAQIDQKVRQDLNRQIISSTNNSYPAAPNFFLEAKGRDGSVAVQTRQACYDGAVGSRAMHTLQSYGQAEPAYNNNASTLSSTYHNGQLKIYSHHVTQPLRSDDLPEYHMTQLGSFALTHSPQSFREGVSAFRNARDFAREQGIMLADQANAVARRQFSDDDVTVEDR
ncbi:MAG: hypothetical protein Q9160_004419 [Pyrenula sp. 1 TL-2023]